MGCFILMRARYPHIHERTSYLFTHSQLCYVDLMASFVYIALFSLALYFSVCWFCFFYLPQSLRHCVHSSGIAVVADVACVCCAVLCAVAVRSAFIATCHDRHWPQARMHNHFLPITLKLLKISRVWFTIVNFELNWFENWFENGPGFIVWIRKKGTQRKNTTCAIDDDYDDLDDDDDDA